MSIDIERLKAILENVITEFGNWDHDTGELRGEQSSALHDVVMMANEVRDYRATHPQAPDAEWVDGLPPIGWHGECTWGNKVDWCECVILPSKRAAVDMGQRGQGWEIRPIDGYDFRPIRTPEQRQREGLHACISDAVSSSAGNEKRSIIADAVDAILSKYTLEPKP